MTIYDPHEADLSDSPSPSAALYRQRARAGIAQTTAAASAGTPTISGDLSIEAPGVLDMVIAGSDPSDYAHLTVAGTISVAGTVMLDFKNGYAPKAGSSFDLFTVAGGMSSLGNNIEVAGLAPGWQFSLADENGDTFVNSLSDGVATSPEPSSVALGSALLAGTVLRRSRRRPRRGR
jgi:hypothetical protein